MNGTCGVEHVGPSLCWACMEGGLGHAGPNRCWPEWNTERFIMPAPAAMNAHPSSSPDPVTLDCFRWTGRRVLKLCIPIRVWHLWQAWRLAWRVHPASILLDLRGVRCPDRRGQRAGAVADGVYTQYPLLLPLTVLDNPQTDLDSVGWEMGGTSRQGPPQIDKWRLRAGEWGTSTNCARRLRLLQSIPMSKRTATRASSRMACGSGARATHRAEAGRPARGGTTAITPAPNGHWYLNLTCPLGVRCAPPLGTLPPVPALVQVPPHAAASLGIPLSQSTEGLGPVQALKVCRVWGWRIPRSPAAVRDIPRG